MIQNSNYFDYFCSNFTTIRSWLSMDKNEEITWLRQLDKGEGWAYEKLFNQLFYSLSSFATKYLEDSESAEDVVQDVFFDFWLKKISFDSVTALKTYFYRSVRNRCLDLLKHQKVISRYFTELSLKEQTEFFLPSVLEEEVYILLKEAIDLLPDPIRQVYDLTLLGHSNQEIVEILDITLDAVKSRKKRGKQLLQTTLKNMFSFLLPLL